MSAALIDTVDASGALWAVRFELTAVAGLLAFLVLHRLAVLRPAALKKAKAAPVEAKPAGKPAEAAPDAGRPRPPIARSLTAAQLRDPGAMVPHVTQLCHAHFHRALETYRAALKAGLSLTQLPEADRRHLIVTLATSAIRSNCSGEVLSLFHDLRRAGLPVPETVFASAVKVNTSKQYFRECLELYDAAVQDASFVLEEKSVWSCLLFCAHEANEIQRCSYFFQRIKESGEPTAKDFWNMIRFAASTSDWALALRLLDEMRAQNIPSDNIVCNTVLAVCVGANKLAQARDLLTQMEKTTGVADAITYNTLMKGLARAGDVEGSFALLERMKAGGIAPSQVTYGILLDACINENLLEKAAEVFATVVQEGLPMNTVLYTTLIKGFSRALQVDKAMEVYRKMRTDSKVSPDVVTYSILIKAHCDANGLEAALTLRDEMVQQGLVPDEIIYNNLLAGCAVQADAARGWQLYDAMIAAGVRPSSATFSILIRVLTECRLFDEAVAMLETEPKKQRVRAEPRLYLQLIQSCIRDRQGKRVLEVYTMMEQVAAPTAAVHSSILGTCLKLNMLDTAKQVLDRAADGGWRVDARDANQLLDVAVRKRKFEAARGCLEAMRRLGLAAEPQLMAKVHSGQSS